MDEAEREAFEAPILETYEREGSPYYSTARLWDDGIIDPLDTRRVLALGLAAAALRAGARDDLRGVPDVSSVRHGPRPGDHAHPQPAATRECA